MCAHEGGLTEPAAAADAAEAGEYAAGATNESSSAAAVSTAPESGDALAPADKPVARPAGGAARRGDGVEQAAREPLVGADVEAAEKPAGDGVVVADVLLGPPHLSLLATFLVFLRFGCLAFGGPVAQIAMMRDELILEQQWMSVPDFNKVFALYQALPGPEATELACLFGMLASRRRIGGLLGGLGFILPGFGLVLLFAWLYDKFSLFENKGFLSSFRAVRPTVPAMAARAVYKLAEHALVDPRAPPPAEYCPMLLSCAAAGMLLTLYNTPFFATLGWAGLCNVAYHHPRLQAGCGGRARALALGLLVAGCVGNTAYVAARGALAPRVALAAGSSIADPLASVFVTGLLAGCTTFGGAFTAVPYVYNSLVVVNKFLTSQQFLDGIAAVNFVPTPLVMFVTWDGFLAKGVAGAVLMTLGMFLPCFSFTLLLHNVFMYLCRSPAFTAFLEGVSAAVIGLVSYTACQLTRDAVHNGMDSLVFACALVTLQTSKSRYAPVGIIFAAAMAGQVLYGNNANAAPS